MKKTFTFLLLITIIMNLFGFNVFAISDNITIVVNVPKMASPNELCADTTGNVTIDITTVENTDTLVRIADPNGKIVYLETLLAQDNKGKYPRLKDSLYTPITFPISTLSEGKYIVGVSDNTGKSANSGEQFLITFYTPPVPTSPPSRRVDPNPITPPPKIDEVEDNGTLLAEAAKVSTAVDATKKIDAMAKGVTDEQKKDSNTSENAALITGIMAGNISSKGVKTSSGNKLDVSKGLISSADLLKVEETVKAIISTLQKNKYELNREIDRELILKVKFDANNKATIVISSKIIDALKGIDVLTIADEKFRISFRVDKLKEELLDMEDGKDLEIYFEKVQVANPTAKLTADSSNFLSGDEVSFTVAVATKSGTKVSFNKKKLKTNAYVSVPPPAKTDTDFQAIKETDSDEIVGGKYNAATEMVEAPIGAGGTYVVEENRLDFTDIEAKDAAMQEAIKVLAAKGIVDGVGDRKFSPDAPISRGEIAKLIVKTLYMQKGGSGFSDTNGKWYKDFAEASRGAGIINGYEDNTFRGDNTILKEQIIAVSARTLREQKKYYNPQDIEQYLNGFSDKANISVWAKSDISLASREGLVIKRSDGKFNGNQGMTRGEAALVLKRLFDRL